jgi:hypothetical protein
MPIVPSTKTEETLSAIPQKPPKINVPNTQMKIFVCFKIKPEKDVLIGVKLWTQSLKLQLPMLKLHSPLLNAKMPPLVLLLALNHAGRKILLEMMGNFILLKNYFFIILNFF